MWARTSETSVDNHFTRQYNPEDSSEHQDKDREKQEGRMWRIRKTRKENKTGDKKEVKYMKADKYVY
jgi:hypothetical protein